MVDMAVGEQYLLDRHALRLRRRLEPVEIAAGIGEDAAHRVRAPQQSAILLERRHRNDRGFHRRRRHAADMTAGRCLSKGTASRPSTRVPAPARWPTRTIRVARATIARRPVPHLPRPCAAPARASVPLLTAW